MTNNSTRLRFPLYLQTLIAMFIGAGLGLVFGEKVAPLGLFAKYVIEVVKLVAVPLLFLAILDTVIRAEFRGKSILWMLGISAINAVCAVTIALLISNIIRPGQYLPLKPPATGMASAQAAATGGVLKIIFGSPMIGAILLSLAIGIGVLVYQKISGPEKTKEFEKFSKMISKALNGWIKVISYILYLIPWAVLGAVAKVVGEHGFKMLHGLSVYLIICIGGMFIHVFLVYHGWIVGIAKMNFRRFWRDAKEPVIHAFGINSSLATLPLSLRCLHRLGVTPASARLSACVGTNFNNDGILLYEVVAVLFLSQAYGHDLTLSQQLLTAFVCVVATVGVGGIPEAGIISLTLVLSAVHLPAEGIPILLTVDWIIARCRSATNVLGDLTVAIALDWLNERKAPNSQAG